MSAIAARRRLAGGDAGESASPETPKGSPIGSHNAYSVLQGLSRQGNSPSQAAAAASASPSAVVRTPRSSAAKRAGGEQKDASLAGEQNPGNVQFSSFRPTKHNHKVRPDDVTELRFEESEVGEPTHPLRGIHANSTQRFLVYGSFGICVLEGEVTVAGASLRPDGKTHWVHAPLCHSLPVLRNREGTRLELHAHSDAVALRQLGRMSPLYRKMWNESGKGKTFQMVSVHTCGFNVKNHG